MLANAFPFLARKHGFRFQRNMAADSTALIVGHSIGFRFFSDEESPFPIWQIGPGIFACNESVNYEWMRYRLLCLKGIETLYAAYPHVNRFSIEPVYLELRYVDAFSEDTLGHCDILRFMRQNTKFGFQLNDYSAKGRLTDRTDGRVVFVRKTKADRNTEFSYEIASGTSSGKRSIIAISKVATKKERIAVPSTRPRQQKFYTGWLDDAHEITSQFFKDFVSDELMQKFRTIASKANA